jgi:hypothetical protein
MEPWQLLRIADECVASEHETDWKDDGRRSNNDNIRGLSSRSLMFRSAAPDDRCMTSADA